MTSLFLTVFCRIFFWRTPAGFFEFLTEVVHIRISGCLCNFGNFHRAFFQKFLSSADPDIGNVLEHRGMLHFFKYASKVGRMQLKIRSYLRNGQGSICIMISDIFHDPAAECDI